MALRASSVLVVKRSLLALLQAAEEFDGALVRLGLPAEEPTVPVRAYVLANLPRDYSDLTQQGGLTERYVIPVALEARVYEDDVDAVEEQIEDLRAVVFALLEADDELGGICLRATPDRVIGPITQPTTDGWLSQLSVEVAVEAWL